MFDFLTRQAASGKPKLVGSRGSMVAKLKLKGIDGRCFMMKSLSLTEVKSVLEGGGRSYLPAGQAAWSRVGT